MSDSKSFNRDSLVPTGWREILISVSDIAATISFFEEMLGWEQRCSGLVSDEILRSWRLPRETGARAMFDILLNNFVPDQCLG